MATPEDEDIERTIYDRAIFSVSFVSPDFVVVRSGVITSSALKRLLRTPVESEKLTKNTARYNLEFAR